MPIRRVATGTTTDGRSVVAFDELLNPVTVSALPGYSWYKLWGFDEPPGDPADAVVSSGESHFPPAGGARFNVFTVPPASTARQPLTAEAQRELDEKLPGRTPRMESDQAGMHRTQSVDLIMVISGSISLELDDGAVVHLKAGDCLVQNGTRHAWRNNSDQPCTLAIVLLGTGPSA